ncbi:polynucleotide kinase-phosphatase [Aureibacillus halotolerans]|uniref:Polynucleotide 3'-phosphatase /polynucleotide 5'-hydroxyl-kinase /polynucleotide 2',3'-cyclic phosphate phosphodiesterase n=1 Tax=Aureibacillus halotolerans TaxID=1508390 RepID=A0A4V3D4H3_9BACI|nr:polynucleotide kinase-phosphatase [Aureibacillus halotolerans]TDQ36237.1 polynucleotide 3'-phosphatase /polynucleotide 5'-hydroxyl-kinase /polynucleotide 2',3'-cyclic phosphate phosphodiesterase [Aureibacillus halotolerans]
MKITLPHAGIVVLVGASNSGKTTMLERLVHEKKVLPSEIVSSDSFREAVGDTDFIQWKQRPKHESDVLYERYETLSKEAFSVMHQLVEARCRMNKLTIIDATHLQPEYRRVYVNMAKATHVPVVAVLLDVPLDLLLERDATRLHSRGKKRVEQQNQQFRKERRDIDKEEFDNVYVVHSPESLELFRASHPLQIDVGSGIDVIGDVHGCYEELIALLDKLGYRENEDGLYIHPEGRRFLSLGDIMSRGPQSLETMRFFLIHIKKGLAYMTDSNHGWKIARWFDGRRVKLTHGDELMEKEWNAYASTAPKQEVDQLKQELKTMLLQAPSHYLLEQNNVVTAVVTHAGMKDKWIGKQSAAISDMCRYGETEGTDDTGRPIRKDWTVTHKTSELIIWGHDPRPQPLLVQQTMNIDQGVVFGGQLTALRYPERVIVSVDAKKDYAEMKDSPLVRWEQKRLKPPGISNYLQGYRVDTEELGTVRLASTLVKSAIETFSTAALPLEQIPYLPPTMSPPPKPSSRPDYLEHPEGAIAYFRAHGVDRLIAQKKHMGSRAVILLFANDDAAKRTIGTAIRGVIYTRTGRRFFDPLMEEKVLHTMQSELLENGYFRDYETDYVLLDTEIMPWNLKAADLIQRQYGHVAKTALLDREQLLQKLEMSTQEYEKLDEWIAEYKHKYANAEAFARVFQRYCWPVTGLKDIQIAPFHVLAHSDQTFEKHPHSWHMEMNKTLAERSTLFVETDYREITDEASEVACTTWWEELTEAGHEGIVIKPQSFVPRYKGKLIQPALKVRGRSYLSMIYGMDYLDTENLVRLKGRKTGKKQKMALKEFALGLEGVRRFVDRQTLERVHECVLATLAMESDPADPRL